MCPQVKWFVLVPCVLFAAVGTGARAQEAATSINAPNTVWRPVWFIEGPISTEVNLEDSDNELRLEGNQIVLVLADGQQWTRALQALRSIRYFRQFERPSAFIMSGEAWAPNPGALFRSTNHFVDLVFSDDSKQETVLTLQLDKRVYQAAIATLHQLTAKPVLASAEDAKALPATLRTERTNQKRTLNPRKLALGPSVALKLAATTDGRMLASVLRDGSVQVWDTETGRAERRWLAVERNRSDWQRSEWIAFRPGSAIVAVSTPKTGIQQWDAHSGARRDFVIPTSSTTLDTPFWFSPDGSKLIVGGPGGFSCWDSEIGARLDCLESYDASLREQVVGPVPDSSGRAATFSANGAQLALATLLTGKTRKPRVLTVLEWPGGRLLQQAGQSGDRMSRAIGFTAKDRLVERYPEYVEAWRIGDSQVTRLWGQSIPFSHNETDFSEELIAAGGRGQEVLLYSAETGRLEARLATGLWVSAVAFVPGARLAVATVAGTVQIWDTSARRIIRVLSPNP